MDPITATRIELDTPQPPPRPDLYALAWPHYVGHTKSWAWCVTSDSNPPMGSAANRPGAVLFKLPADPKPPTPPAPSDWRQACKVVKCVVRWWDVLSPDGKRFLCGDSSDEWCEINKDTDIDFGMFATEEIARAALSIAPVPPGVSQ